MSEPLHGVLVVGQSGGPTPVINASLAGTIGEAQRHECFTGIYGLVHGIEGALKEELLNLGGETADSLELLARTPASARFGPTPGSTESGRVRNPSGQAGSSKGASHSHAATTRSRRSESSSGASKASRKASTPFRKSGGSLHASTASQAMCTVLPSPITFSR